MTFTTETTVFFSTLKDLRQNRTFQRMYITLQGSAGPFFAGVIFGYVYYHTKQSHVKRTWVSPLLLY
jgi:hypothetical protein